MDNEQPINGGCGFTYCLGLFLIHEGEWVSVLKNSRTSTKTNIENEAALQWIFSASDHLLDLIVPVAFRIGNPEMAVKADWLKKEVMDMLKACLSLSSVTEYTEEDVFALLDTAREILMAADRWMGVEVIPATIE